MMFKTIFLLFAYVSITVGVLLNRTDTIHWVYMRTSNQFRGVNLTKIPNGYEILWSEYIDCNKHTLNGTKAVYRVPDPYTYPTENRECGRVDGRVSIFKRNLQKPRLNPLVLGIHFLGNVTGAECSN
ncbi:uncharacterized protein LOC127288379 isoform X1 [Leptopilina boulardi]|uniref:uncharacterized protein LOC127288379 isoform X1 n=1 Tax=Leptopilina boulardi TaxID=63433 RepID=UPI0021F6223A|nr:uncharacterized protein LOC127288379 isoform X1 [Leptopilina boulardi]